MTRVWPVMSRDDWVKRWNQQLKKIGQRLVHIQGDDPRWPTLGDYVLVNRKSNSIKMQHVNLFDIAPTMMLKKVGVKRSPIKVKR
jgi:hypothetical protein